MASNAALVAQLDKFATKLRLDAEGFGSNDSVTHPGYLVMTMARLFERAAAAIKADSDPWRCAETLKPFADLFDWIAENRPEFATDAHEVQIEGWPYTLSVGSLKNAKVAITDRPSEIAA